MHPFITLVCYAFLFVSQSRDAGRIKSSCFHSIDIPKENTFPPTINPSKRIKIRIPIVQYHDEWVCVNKPPGMSIHKTKNIPLENILDITIDKSPYKVEKILLRKTDFIPNLNRVKL